MELYDYFENTPGTGFLSTADARGQVNVALYARPHVLTEDKLAMIARPRLTYRNLQENPRAVYAFLEEGPGYQGKRLYLEKIEEEKDSPWLAQLKRRPAASSCKMDSEGQYLLVFRITGIRPLVGGDPDPA